MSRFQRTLVICGLLMVVVFDALLLRQLTVLREENATLRNKITPSLDEQFALYEHSLEGVDLTAILAELRVTAPRLDAFEPRPDTPRVLFYFPDKVSCRRSLHREVGILKENQSLLARHGIAAGIVLANIEEIDFQLLTRQYDVSEISVLDRQGVFQRHLGARPSALVMVLDPRNTVLFAQVARTSGDEGARPLYRKIELVTGLRPRAASANEGKDDDGQPVR
ncbi:MAG: hypothetical protein A3H96_23710 [Acidobacteria bacterium RIFCSPLOWO2_02_FULL_67_36]|nr:MAG: hypothetical protein A3H96_23710 [Acidobacteria bacterium RIFCSPLOWO2_02_FULL_67_36]OFW20552.1 MAG: hypothetical protein A3G21_23320 [Acidobacteria bacterium RIFCSPLOWO2_12_FULL_66_21]